jgi:2-alkenal reductase
MRVPVAGCRLSLNAGAGLGLLCAMLAMSAAAFAQQPRAVTPRGPLPESERAVIALFQRAAPSVAYIFTITAREDLLGHRQVSGGAGSGFIWDSGGHIVTNYHVVEGADRVAVALDAGEPLAARVVGTAPNYDLAVLQLNQRRNDLPPIQLGTSADLKVGQWVFAIGNPFGLTRTMTTGVISALDRHLPTDNGREIANVVQTDAAINPGNSGGPLLDSAGRLIGMNTAIVSGSGASAGVGFAIPVDTINRVVPQLIAHGRVPTAGIGVYVLPEDLATKLGVKGVPVAQVAPRSPAAAAGLTGMDTTRGRLGDVITQVNGKNVSNLAEMAAALDGIGIGKRAELTVMRDGRSRKVPVEVTDISSESAAR